MLIDLPSNYKETINQRIDELEAKLLKISPNIYLEYENVIDDDCFGIIIMYHFRDGRSQLLSEIILDNVNKQIWDTRVSDFGYCKNAKEERRLWVIMSKVVVTAWDVFGSMMNIVRK